ncbi:MAG: tRNA (N6-threonylcarbamoyladenosine(37)-N6)-methyltransferase TrmO [Sedimentisphaerales bacterium]|nr:tRNA (N6-threonylcarbamoyladenosine(37)-N6)-methyltransferase TrmO [Sedimentisphaerales bacterium]
MNREHHKLMNLNPIGVVHSSFTEATGAPIQPAFAKETQGTVEVYEPYREGLKDLEGFERIWLLYWLDRASAPKLLVKPYLDRVQRGLFATRAPARPNPIGLSAVRILSVENGSIAVAELDILDGTPLLDIKPYISKFDCYQVARNGWLDRVDSARGIADDRFYDRSNQETDI